MWECKNIGPQPVTPLDISALYKITLNYFSIRQFLVYSIFISALPQFVSHLQSQFQFILSWDRIIEQKLNVDVILFLKSIIM